MASHRGQVLQKIRCGAGFILSDSQGLRAGVKERENGEGAFETAFEEPPPGSTGSVRAALADDWTAGGATAVRAW